MRLGRNHVSPVLSLLKREYPALEVWVELLDRRVDLIGEGFDIDIRMAEVTEPHLVRHLIAKNKRILCAAPAYLERRGRPETLADLALHDCLLYRERHLTFGVWRMDGPDGPERLLAVSADREFFSLLGVAPAAGRTFRADDPQDVAVISGRLWQRRFNADPSIVGQKVTLDGRPFTLIGVSRLAYPELLVELEAIAAR